MEAILVNREQADSEGVWIQIYSITHRRQKRNRYIRKKKRKQKEEKSTASRINSKKGVNHPRNSSNSKNDLYPYQKEMREL